LTRKLVLFGATLFAGLIAGGQYLVWWDYDPAGVSPAFYTEKIQYAIRVIGMPLFAVQITTAILTLVSAVLGRRRPGSYFLLAAAVLGVTGVMLTFFGNIPLLNEMATWNIASPPPNWQAVAGKWWLLHNVRFLIQLTVFCLLLWTGLMAKPTDGR
jgi:uncharacterized membrane protein